MNLVIVGAQWGDEGKGKMVDYLAEGADLVVRFSGGANAGHTIMVGGKTFKLHLVPAGITHPEKEVALGNGMVVDPAALFEELALLESQGIAWKGRLHLSDRAHLVLPRYRAEDQSVDESRPRPIGTTGRGIGVAYGRKASRDGVRVADLWDPVVWEALDSSDREWLAPFRDRLDELRVNFATFMKGRGSSRVLLEGAQGALLDLDHGTYPYVSSGISVTAGASLGAAIGPRAIDRCWGVLKAYQTRVGNGPFPTEMLGKDEALGNEIRELGHEYGATTGRPRRIGYLDLPALAYSCWINSLDGLILSHLNIFDDFDEIKVAVAYEIDGQRTEEFPSSPAELEKIVPVLETFSGWDGKVADARRWEDMPTGAADFVGFVESAVGAPVVGFSVGPLRDQTFLREDPWTPS